MCADAEFWHKHTVVEQEGHRTQRVRRTLNKATEGPALERECMRAEQGVQRGNSPGKKVVEGPTY